MNRKAESFMDSSFIGHLEALRIRLLIVLGVFFAFSAAALVFVQDLFEFLLVPIKGIDIPLIYIKPQEKVLTYLRTGLFYGAAGALPFGTVILGGFVYPGLKRNERSVYFVSLFLALFFYIAGIVFAYVIILPFAVTFFGTFTSGDGIEPFWSMGAYFRISSSIILAMALVFQLPCVLLFLIRAGLVSPEGLAKYRKHAVIVILLTAAFLTPPDIFTQILVGAILYLLFEGTLAAGKIIIRRKEKKNNGPA
ncbi:MAG: twin-arginine translocase subunit TatC [Spirochaetia bacterium]